jgi:hypothetical protein
VFLNGAHPLSEFTRHFEKQSERLLVVKGFELLSEWQLSEEQS